MNIPPKVMRREVRERTLASRQAPPGDAMPVLDAFGEFLETERRRTRARILALSMAFLALLLLVAGVGFLVGAVFLSHIRADFGDVQRDLRAVEAENTRLRADTQAALARLDDARQSIGSNVEEHAAALARTRQDVDAGRQEAAREVASMREVVKMLEIENRNLRDDLGSLREKIPEMADSLRDLVGKVAAIRETAPTGAVAAAVEPAAPAIAAGASIRMEILRRGAARRVAWRLPIPE